MDKHDVLRRFDEQVRRDIVAEPGFRIERTRRLVRVVGLWNCVLYADVDAECADAQIRAQQDSLRGTGESLEWKVYGHDRPHDLGQRLERAGFEPNEAETLMVLDLRGALPSDAPPTGITLRRILEAAGLGHVGRVGKLAFGVDFSAMNAEFAARLPLGTVSFYVAYDGTEPVAAARLELPPNGDFAGLYGGGTVPAYRGRGIYRSLVAARAQKARGRGYRYLNVEAADASRSILQRLGFVPLTSVRGWTWQNDTVRP